MFFQNRPQGQFLEGPGADVASTGRFGAIFDLRDFEKAPFGCPKGDQVVPGNNTRRVLGPTREMLEHWKTPTKLDLRFFLRFVLRAMFAFSHFTGTVLPKYMLFPTSSEWGC